MSDVSNVREEGELSESELGETAGGQAQVEKDRGSRKDGRTGTGSTTGTASNGGPCDYGGLNGGDYPPSSFPF